MEFDVFKYNLTDEERKWLSLDTEKGVEDYQRILALDSEFGKLRYITGLLAFRGERKKAKELIEASHLSELDKLNLIQDVYFDVLDDEEEKDEL